MGWLEEVQTNTQYTQLSFEEVDLQEECVRASSAANPTASALLTSIGATLVEVFQLSQRQGRIFERLNLEFCEGPVDLVISSALLMECVKHMFFTAAPEDEEEGILLESILWRAFSTLRINQSLQSLWLLVPLPVSSAQLLGEALAYNDTLRKLSLSGSTWGNLEDGELENDNNFTDTSDDSDDDDNSAYYSTMATEAETESAEEIRAKAMSKLKQSSQRNFSSSSPLPATKREAALALAKGLKQNVSLRTVDFSCSNLSDDAAAVLVEALIGQPALISLNLSGNHCRDQTIMALAELISHPDCQLTDLNFGEQCKKETPKKKGKFRRTNKKSNKHPDELLPPVMDLGPLARALMTNDVLQTLKLSHNRLDDDSIIELVRNLQGNSILQELDLEFNQITPHGLRALTKGLNELPSLQILKLGGNAFGKEGNRLLAQLEDDDDSVCTIMEEEDDSFFSAKSKRSHGSSKTGSGGLFKSPTKSPTKSPSKRKGTFGGKLLGGLTGISEK